MAALSGNRLVRIDGSEGEGGGQILRTSLALSCVTGRPVEISNIRKRRARPGLQPQHLTAVKAAAAVSRARVEGGALSSTALRFAPSGLFGGEHLFDVAEIKGSAGSVTLVLQTVMLPLFFADRASRITVLGGTHVPWSPSCHYFRDVFLPLLTRSGVNAAASIETWGWYPIGGGKVVLTIQPGKELGPVMITGRGKLVGITGTSAVSNLPREIAERQRKQALSILGRRGIDAEIEIISAPSPGKGTLLFLRAEFEQIAAGFESLGAIGKRAEQVADEAARDLCSFLEAEGALDPHLADQIVPYCALAQGGSAFTTSEITSHLLTNVRVVKHFLDVGIRIEGNEGQEGTITFRP